MATAQVCNKLFLYVQPLWCYIKARKFQTFDLEYEGKDHLPSDWCSMAQCLLSTNKRMSKKYVYKFSRSKAIAKSIKFRQFILENEGQ